MCPCLHTVSSVPQDILMFLPPPLPPKRINLKVKIVEFCFLKLRLSSQFSSVQFSRSVMSSSLRPHESQDTRPPCPSPTPGVHSDSHPSSQRCHPAISSYHPLLLLPPIPPSIRVFSNEPSLRVRWPKYWSFSFSIIPSKEHSRLISLQSKGLSRVFSSTTVQKH